MRAWWYNTDMSLMQATQLGKVFALTETPTVALRGVDLSIEKGDFLAVVGPSGSGKSTLLQILGLLDPQTEGTYRFLDKDTTTLSDDELARLRNTAIGFIFQSFNLLPRTSVLENVMLPLAYSQFPMREWKTRAQAAIEAVGLTHRMLHEPAQLSGGERQRVAIARALVTEPDVIFADEPTGNLDSASGAAVMAILEKLHDQGKTIILITHDRSIAKRAGRAIYMKDGEVIWQGDPLKIPDA